jgi:butyrate kinase
VEKRIEAGDAHAQAVYEAFAYQVSKGIGELSVVLGGNIDAIILTGGGAKSRMLTDWITNRVKFIAPVYIMAGENEMESLAFGALRLLSGEEIVKVYAT